MTTKCDSDCSIITKELALTQESVEHDPQLRYDQLADKYDEVFDQLGWDDPERCAKKMIENGVKSGDIVLDLGCGTGLVGV